MQKCSNLKGVGTMKKSNNLSLRYMLIKIFPKIFAVAPKIFIFNYILFLINGLLYMSTTLGMQFLFDKVNYLSLNKRGIKEAIIALTVLLAIKVLSEIVSGVANFLAESYDPQVTRELSHDINLKIAKLDPICFENSEILNSINKSYLGIGYAVQYINTIMDGILFYFPYFLFMGIYLFRLKKTLVISLILVFLPSIYTVFIKRKFSLDLEENIAPLRRKVDYYGECIVGRKYTKETRILGIQSYFMKLLKDSIQIMNGLQRSTTIKINLIELSVKLVSLLGYLGVFLITFYALINKEIGVGAFAAIFASIDSMFSLMEEFICGRLNHYAGNFGKVENFLSLLQLSERDYNKENLKTKRDSIQLKNVCFSYPGSDKEAVHDINLEINKGETLAIVGENGSGKSTLVKLIMGMYLPTEGEILFDGINSKKFTMKNIFKNVSVVFQDFQKYQLTLRDNIQISDFNNKDSNNERLELVLKNAGIDSGHKNFELGYNTMLSREFGGVDLSGGQWQRIAIARGLYRNSDFVVLDEPTSAIDPIEETKIYKDFNTAVLDKTALIVTHRLGSIKFSDRIVVMKEGRILDVGTHKEIIERCEFYKTMWNSQAKYYEK